MVRAGKTRSPTMVWPGPEGDGRKSRVGGKDMGFTHTAGRPRDRVGFHSGLAKSSGRHAASARRKADPRKTRSRRADQARTEDRALAACSAVASAAAGVAPEGKPQG